MRAVRKCPELMPPRGVLRVWSSGDAAEACLPHSFMSRDGRIHRPETWAPSQSGAGPTTRAKPSQPSPDKSRLAVTYRSSLAVDYSRQTLKLRVTMSI